MDRSRRRALRAMGIAGLVGLSGCLRAGEVRGGESPRGDETDPWLPDRKTHEADLASSASGGNGDDPDGDTGSWLGEDEQERRGAEHDEAASETENPAELPDNGVVSFVYHDGPLSDYTQAFRAHEAFDTVATTCPVTGWIGRRYGVAERLGWRHLRTMRDAGWEIASHTADHATLGEFALLEDASPDDTRIYPEAHRHGHQEGLRVEVTDGHTAVRRTVAGYGVDDREERYVELAEPLGAAFDRSEAVVRWPADRMHYTLGASKEALAHRGFQVDTLLAPYDNFGDYARRFVPRYYDYVVNASRETPRINRPETYRPYETRHRYFIEYTTRDRVKADLDTIAETGAFGVFGAHAFKDEVTEARIRETLQWIADRDIEVMTFREAAELYSARRD